MQVAQPYMCPQGHLVLTAQAALASAPKRLALCESLYLVTLLAPQTAQARSSEVLVAW